MFGKKKKKGTSVTVQEEPSEEDKKYYMMFKCSMCGKIFASNEKFAVSQMGVGDNTHSMHYCDNGDIGRLEFLGLRPTEQPTYDGKNDEVTVKEAMDKNVGENEDDEDT